MWVVFLFLPVHCCGPSGLIVVCCLHIVAVHLGLVFAVVLPCNGPCGVGFLCVCLSIVVVNLGLIFAAVLPCGGPCGFDVFAFACAKLWSIWV